MEETLKKLSQEIKDQLKAVFAEGNFQSFIKATQESTDSGTFEVIISTADIDRSGESIDQAGWDLSFYKLNPIVLWAHDYHQLPIGVTDEIGVNAQGQLVAKGRFAPADANPFAQQVRKLYDLKIVRTTSVGFIVEEAEGNLIRKSQLLEFSFVPVPCNPYALSLAKAQELGIDLEFIKAKGLELEVKTGEPIETEEKPKTNEPTVEETETETETETKPEETKEKGAVADQMNAEETWEKKWGYIDEVYEIIGAFFDVYLNEQTPVDDFGKLLTETAGLLAELAKNPVSEDDEEQTEKSAILKAKKEKASDLLEILEKRKIGTKSGRTLSGNSVDKLQAISDQFKTTTAALDGFINEATAQGDGSGDNQDDGESQQTDETKQRSETAGFDLLMRSLDDFITVRQALRPIANAVSNALESVNTRIREQSPRKINK